LAIISAVGTAGGRVPNVTATGKTLKEAQTRAYCAVDVVLLAHVNAYE